MRTKIYGISMVALVLAGAACESEGYLQSAGSGRAGEIGAEASREGASREAESAVGVGASRPSNAVPCKGNPATCTMGLIELGSSYAVAVKSDGSVWGWGYNFYGQLGDGGNSEKHTPAKFFGLSGVIAIAAGIAHTVALKQDGSVWATGDNEYGQLGDASNFYKLFPVQVQALSGVIDVAAGKSSAWR